MKIVINVFKYILFFLLLVIIFIGGYNIVVKLVFKNPQPKLFGYSTAVVLSDSMKPEFVEGDLLIFKKQNKYAVNDIIIFNDDGYLTTHRIVDILEDGRFVTRGDANNTNDTNPVAISDVHGKMIKRVAKVGLVLEFLSSPIGLVLIVVVAFCVIELPNIIKFFKKESEQKE